MLLYLSLIFITTVSFFWLLYLIFFQRKYQVKERLREQGSRQGMSEAKGKKGKSSITDRLSDFYHATSYYKKQKKLLSKAYVHMKPEELINISLLLGTIFALLVWLFQKNLLLVLIVFFIGAILPSIILTFIAGRRAKQMNAQLPQALNLISNGLRAGFSFNQSLGIVNEEMEAPIGEEFGKIMRDNQLGKPIDVALAEFGDRTDDEDISIFVTTLLTQLQVGGDLAEVLDIIAHTVRERAELRGHISTLTSQSKMSAVIIGILPLAVAGMIFIMNPDYITVLFNDPLGLVMMATAGVMMLIGIFTLYKIVNIKI